MSKFLVTGVAGFIGYHLAERLLGRGDEVLGLDNLNAYYDVRLKEARLSRLDGQSGFRFTRIDLAEREGIAEQVADFRPDVIVSLAAQAGVRYSLSNPHAYIDSNITGFLNVLEACRKTPVRHLVYASSSSVYGANTKLPFAVTDNVDNPVSMYAATKKANELMAHTYSHLFGIPTTGLRFFTVYGPWGRPDMALFIFTKAILEGRPIDVYNSGDMQRDFTYVDDIVEGIVRVCDRPPVANPIGEIGAGKAKAPYRVYNIGNNAPVPLLEMIGLLERTLGRVTEKRLLPLQAGDVPATYADVEDLAMDVGFRPATPLETGIERFVAWYREFYGA